MTPTPPSTSTPPSGTHDLKRVLRLGDLVLFNVVAVLGLRWVATSAKAGPSSLILWLLAAALFFIPQGIAVITLASRFPEEGGVYAWTRRSFGEWNGFLCGWCYWINNVLYYPNLLISTAVIATYAIGKGGTTLGESWPYVLSVSLAALWIAALLNIVGLGTGKWLHNIGGVATYLPGVTLIVLGLAAVFMHPSANAFTRERLVPDVTELSTLNLWASIAFAFAGLELSSTMGEETANPRRDLPRAIVISAPLIAVAYILGTLSVLWLVPNDELNIVSGFLQGISAGSAALSPGLVWIAPVAAAMYTVSNVAGVGAWLSGPARVAFVIGLDRYFPPAFGKVHPQWRTPYVAILAQAVLATVFLLVSQLGKGSTVEQAYLVLLDTQLLIYFIPYLYLFLCLLRQARSESQTGSLPGGRAGATLAGICGLGVTAFAMVVASIPPGDAPSRGVFAAKVIGGAAAFVALGAAIYLRGRGSRRRVAA
jgi:amino acid transporter